MSVTRCPEGDWRREPAGKDGLRLSPRRGGLATAGRLWVRRRHVLQGSPRAAAASRAADAGEQGLVPRTWDLPARGRELTAQLQPALPVRGWGTGLSVTACSWGLGVEALVRGKKRGSRIDTKEGFGRVVGTG